MITFEDAKRLMAQGAKVIDVRRQNEFLEGHVPGALHIPVEEILFQSEENLPKDDTYILYCHSGYRSSLALEALRMKGYTQLYNLGGVDNWKETLER